MDSPNIQEEYRLAFEEVKKNQETEPIKFEPIPIHDHDKILINCAEDEFPSKEEWIKGLQAICQEHEIRFETNETAEVLHQKLYNKFGKANGKW